MKRRIRTLLLIIVFPIVTVVAMNLVNAKEDIQPVKVNTSSKEEVVVQNKGNHLGDINVIIDPGHGGNDGGAVGEYGTLEKDATLETAKRIKATLEQAGINVKLRRNGDDFVDRKERVAMAQGEQVDLFISIHYDGFEQEEVKGITSYYYHERDRKIAQLVHNYLFKESIETRNRGVSEGDYFVLRENSVPAILLELGYITNKEDEVLIQSDNFQESISGAIRDAIIDYFQG
ncbi:N-acetylmuramoyl-L-alanine amidase [Virgibacillus soli]|uniref:N-acetylmuramoyl-L-alanine amidase n=1 Tax=Paracerasibacillus soli TaxID=480284 RepID=A0ABU5CV71_9BACI|nr:N-acetylmuramoyl-L-alanine amidase [Virgibacillus soli]MDY0409707.1 N-acetylmuramoyl-L-alanine amidase [Virgibacillus soli]